MISLNSDLTIKVLDKAFSRESVPMELVTDNSFHFAEDAVTN